MNNLSNDKELVTKLQRECDIIEWNMLKPHYGQGILIIVDEKLDIITAGVTIAKDNKVQIENWIEDQSLIKPTPQQTIDWDKHNARFKSLVIAPFVLIQLINH